jgi:hypothetical protein
LPEEVSMVWRDFVDFETIALVSKHVSGALVIIGGFLIIGTAANWAIKDSILSPLVHYAETVIGGACVLRAVIVMLWKLGAMTKKTMKGGGGGTASSILVA